MSVDIHTPAGRLHAFVKLRASLDESVSAWWFGGIQYAVTDLKPVRLFRVHGIQLSQYLRQAEGSFEHRFRELQFYCDLVTGELLEQFEHPVTGEMLKPPIFRVGPMSVMYGPGKAWLKPGDTLPEGLPKGLDVSWRVDPAIVAGDDLILHEEGHSVAAGAKPFVVNDFITTQGSLQDVLNPEIINAPARQSYQAANSWAPWLQMDGQPGYQMARGNGKKLQSRNDLPPQFAKILSRHAGDWLDDVQFPG